MGTSPPDFKSGGYEYPPPPPPPSPGGDAPGWVTFAVKRLAKRQWTCHHSVIATHPRYELPNGEDAPAHRTGDPGCALGAARYVTGRRPWTASLRQVSDARGAPAGGRAPSGERCVAGDRVWRSVVLGGSVAGPPDMRSEARRKWRVWEGKERRCAIIGDVLWSVDACAPLGDEKRTIGKTLLGLGHRISVIDSLSEADKSSVSNLKAALLREFGDTTQQSQRYLLTRQQWDGAP